MKNAIALGAAGILGVGGAFVITTTSPSWAMPVLSNTPAVRIAASIQVTDVQYYRHGYYGRGYGYPYWGNPYPYPFGYGCGGWRDDEFYRRFQRSGYGYPYWGNPYPYPYPYPYPFGYGCGGWRDDEFYRRFHQFDEQGEN
jgi:hypothetical protein